MKIITASHGPLSRAIVESASLIVGKDLSMEIPFISIEMSTSKDDAQREIDRIFKSFAPDDDVLALTDVYGGSITKFLAENIGIRRLYVISGVNLGMLLEAYFMKDSMDINELVDHLLSTGKDGICYVNSLMDFSSKGADEI